MAQKQGDDQDALALFARVTADVASSSANPGARENDETKNPKNVSLTTDEVLSDGEDETGTPRSLSRDKFGREHGGMVSTPSGNGMAFQHRTTPQGGAGGERTAMSTPRNFSSLNNRQGTPFKSPMSMADSMDDNMDIDGGVGGDASDLMRLPAWVKDGRVVFKGQKYKGAWTKSEDAMLVQVVQELAPKKWSRIAFRLASGRNSKQCRERWSNQVNPNLRRDRWTEEEDLKILEAHKVHGNKWADIAKYLPGRTDNMIKNRFNGSLKTRSMRAAMSQTAKGSGTPNRKVARKQAKSSSAKGKRTTRGRSSGKRGPSSGESESSEGDDEDTEDEADERRAALALGVLSNSPARTKRRRASTATTPSKTGSGAKRSLTAGSARRRHTETTTGHTLPPSGLNTSNAVGPAAIKANKAIRAKADAAAAAADADAVADASGTSASASASTSAPISSGPTVPYHHITAVRPIAPVVTKFRYEGQEIPRPWRPMSYYLFGLYVANGSKTEQAIRVNFYWNEHMREVTLTQPLMNQPARNLVAVEMMSGALEPIVTEMVHQTLHSFGRVLGAAEFVNVLAAEVADHLKFRLSEPVLDLWNAIRHVSGPAEEVAAAAAAAAANAAVAAAQAQVNVDTVQASMSKGDQHEVASYMAHVADERSTIADAGTTNTATASSADTSAGIPATTDGSGPLSLGYGAANSAAGVGSAQRSYERHNYLPVSRSRNRHEGTVQPIRDADGLMTKLMSVMQGREKRPISDKPCNCRKSRCLKMYCECFTEQQYCGDMCTCSECHNKGNPVHMDEWYDAYVRCRERNPFAFVKKNEEVTRCRCRNTRCIKKYCDCFRAGVLCNPGCRCQNCSNSAQSALLGLAQGEESVVDQPNWSAEAAAAGGASAGNRAAMLKATDPRFKNVPIGVIALAGTSADGGPMPEYNHNANNLSNTTNSNNSNPNEVHM